MPRNTVRAILDADSRGWVQGFDKAETKAVGFGVAVGTLAGNVAFDLGQKAVGAIGDFVRESGESFSRLEQAVGGTEAVFGSFRGAVDEAARGSAESIGLSEAAFREATTSIGGQLKRMTGDVEFAADQSIMLTEVAADLAATYGGTTAEAVGALGAAFRGEADPAERFNLNLKIGAQNAKAVELGLADATSEVDDNARAQATLALILEQSADAQGQFARESDTAAGKTQRLTAAIENQQARLGDSAAEWELFWLQQKANVAEGGAVVLNWFSQFSDDVTAAEKDIREFEIRTGASADTAAAAITIWKEYGTSIFDLLPHLNLTAEELRKLRDADEEWLISLGWTEEGIRKVDAAVQELLDPLEQQEQQTQRLLDINTDLPPVLEDTADATEDLGDVSEDTEEEIKGVNEQLEEQYGRLQALQRQLRAQVDPTFAYMQAQTDLAEAQQAYNDAVDEFGENSPEAIRAAEDIARANADLQQSVVDIGEKGVPAAIESLKALGVPDAVIQKFKDDKARIEEIFDNLMLRVGVIAPTLFPTTPASGGVGWRSESRSYFQHGGIVTDPVMGVIGEAGDDEAVIPLNNEGIKVLGAALREAMGGQTMGGGIVIPIQGDVYGIDDLEDRIVTAVEKARRRGVAV